MPDVILAGAAFLCAAYFVVIVLYSGITTSFAFIWLFFSALFIFLAYGRWYYSKNADRIPDWVPVSIITTCLAGTGLFILLCVLVFSGAAGRAHAGLDYCIVLGARVQENTVSNSLKNRLDRAAEYALESPETYLVLSGGKSDGELNASEARIMYEYLVKKGVPPDRLLLEEISASTVENIAYSRILIERHRALLKEAEGFKEHQGAGRRSAGIMAVEDRPVEVGVLTSDFHLFRALMTAKKWGFEHVCGIPARSDAVLFVHLCVRECASIIKDRLAGNM